MSEPLFSVVVPTYNRVSLLGRMLEAWRDQEPADLPFEVVLVDDGSNDGTYELARSFESDRFRLLCRQQENSGPAQARNVALQEASGRFVFFTGDDIEPTPNLLAEHLRAHEHFGSKKAAVLGRIEWADGQDINATMRHIDGVGAEQFSYHYLVDKAPYDFRHFYTSNVSLRRSLMQQEREGFSTDFPYAAFEDAEYSYRLRGHGLQIYYWQNALAHHYHPYVASTFFQRQLKCGAMAHLFWTREPQVEPLLGVGDIRRTANRLRWKRRFGLGRVQELDVERTERAVLALGDACDPLPLVDTPKLYSPIFRYGYVSGYIDRGYDDGDAAALKSLYSRSLFAKLPGTVRKQLRKEAIDVPEVEVQELENSLR